MRKELRDAILQQHACRDFLMKILFCNSVLIIKQQRIPSFNSSSLQRSRLAEPKKKQKSSQLCEKERHRDRAKERDRQTDRDRDRETERRTDLVPKPRRRKRWRLFAILLTTPFVLQIAKPTAALKSIQSSSTNLHIKQERIPSFNSQRSGLDEPKKKQKIVQLCERERERDR